MLLTMLLHRKSTSFISATFSYGCLNKLDTSSLIGSFWSDAAKSVWLIQICLLVTPFDGQFGFVMAAGVSPNKSHLTELQTTANKQI